MQLEFQFVKQVEADSAKFIKERLRMKIGMIFDEINKLTKSEKSVIQIYGDAMVSTFVSLRRKQVEDDGWPLKKSLSKTKC